MNYAAYAYPMYTYIIPVVQSPKGKWFKSFILNVLNSKYILYYMILQFKRHWVLIIVYKYIYCRDIKSECLKWLI